MVTGCFLRTQGSRASCSCQQGARRSDLQVWLALSGPLRRRHRIRPLLTSLRVACVCSQTCGLVQRLVQQHRRLGQGRQVVKPSRLPAKQAGTSRPHVWRLRWLQGLQKLVAIELVQPRALEKALLRELAHEDRSQGKYSSNICISVPKSPDCWSQARFFGAVGKHNRETAEVGGRKGSGQ